MEELIARLHEAGLISGFTLFDAGKGWQAGYQVHRTEGWHIGVSRNPVEAAMTALDFGKRMLARQDDDTDLLGPEDRDLIG